MSVGPYLLTVSGQYLQSSISGGDADRLYFPDISYPSK